MARQETIYNLTIQEADGLPLSSSKKPPNAYVEAKLEKHKLRTKVIQRTVQPQWNEIIQLSISISHDPSATLALRVMHKSSLLLSKSSFLCGLEVDIGNVARDCEQAQDKKLYLPLRDETGTSQGRICISCAIQEAQSAAATAISTSSQAAETFQDSGGPMAVAQNVGGAVTAASTAIDFSLSLGVVLGKLDVFIRLVDETAKLHPYAQVAWGIVSSVYKVVQGQVTRDQNVIELVKTMENTYSFVDAIESIPNKVEVLEDVIQCILNQTVECAIFIREYLGHGFGKRLVRGVLSDHDARVEKLCQSFVDLRRDFESGVAVQTTLVSWRIKEDVSILVREQALLKLRPTEMDPYGRAPCLPGTRQSILNSIISWVTLPSPSPHPQNVLWLHGLAGTGKSTLSTTLSNYFQSLRRLAAFLFFDRNFVDRSHPGKVVRTLAYQLAEFDPRIGERISEAVEKNPRISESPVHVQFTRLLVEPLSSPDDSTITILDEGPIVFILDSLDECGSAADRTELLEVLADGSSKLPASFRFIITSRPQDDIYDTFTSKPHILPQELTLASDTNTHDVQTFIQHRTSAIGAKKKLAAGWPGEEKISTLVERSSGLFIWAATVSNFIDAQNPPKRLDLILESSHSPSGAEKTIDNLYRIALESAGDWDEDEDFVADVREILGLVLVLRSPLSSASIHWLLGSSESKSTERTVLQLGCLLQQQPAVRVLHPSFADFLTTRSRCVRDEWYFDTVYYNRELAFQCLRCLNVTLKRNICNLTLSEPPTEETLPEGVSYACHYFVDHVCVVEDDCSSLVELLSVFLHQHLLHWLEVMSILKRSRDVQGQCNRLLTWVVAHSSDRDTLCQLIRDASRFSHVFSDSMEEHPLLVYSTALPFTPVNTLLYKTFHDPSSFPTLTGDVEQSWSPLLSTIRENVGYIKSVAVSSRGMIATGSAGNSVQLWDMASGLEALPALQGHEDQVASVSFSPDGSRIASGSWDKTIRIWDANTGAEVLPPLRGHENIVRSVAFSPDGRYIVSGSHDGTIRVWDVALGAEAFPAFGLGPWVFSVCFSSDQKCIVSGQSSTVQVWDATSGDAVFPTPLQGHDSEVWSVAMSGTRIVSGSIDKSIRIWDASTGSLILTIPEHGSGIRSVDFSRDGSRIVSASNDSTVRIWDAHSGEQVLPTLYGHRDSVNAVALSLDGKRIVSGSDDETIRVWDAFPDADAVHKESGGRAVVIAFSPTGGQVVVGLIDGTIRRIDSSSGDDVLPVLRGHSSHILSVAFSADETRIISGSNDETIRVWDAVSGAETLPALKGHHSPVSAVAFSPDGTRILSSAYDGTIGLWDAVSAQLIFPMLRGHTLGILSAAFSPDGSQIASSSEDTTVRIWDVISGQESAPALTGHTNRINSVIFSADGKQVVALNVSESVVWDIASRRRIPLDERKVACAPLETTSAEVLLYVSKGYWIVDTITQKRLSKVPSSIAPTCLSAAWGNAFAIGTASGQVLILHLGQVSN